MNISLHQLRRLGLLVVLVVSVVVISGGKAMGQTIPAGFDDYFIQPTSTVDFSTLPIPADFFGPGSDPFVETVCIEGDTIIERTSDGTLPTATIPIEIIALNLTSCEPITVNSGSNTELWDLSVHLLGPGPSSAPAAGTLTATKTHPNGGVFDSTLTTQPVYVFTEVGNPLNMRVLDFYIEGIPPFDLNSVGDDWSNQNPVGIPVNPSNFYPGGTPGDQSIAPATILLSGGPLQLDLVQAPEPATMSLLTIGGIALIKRKKRINRNC